MCYEVWYYALFGAAVFLRGALRWLVLAAMAWLAGWQILLLLPVWLAGVWLHRAEWPRTVVAERAPVLLAGCLAAVMLVTTWDMPVPLGLSEWVVSDYVMAVIVVVALAALRPLAAANAHLLEHIAKPSSYAAGFSFTLYLFHPPVLTLLYAAGMGTGDSVLHLVSAILLTVAICAGIAELVERRTPALRRAVTRLLEPRRTRQVASV